MEKLKAVAEQLRTTHDQMTRAIAVDPNHLRTIEVAIAEIEEQIAQHDLTVQLAAHEECPDNLGLGGTIAWHREKINKLRHRLTESDI